MKLYNIVFQSHHIKKKDRKHMLKTRDNRKITKEGRDIPEGQSNSRFPSIKTVYSKLHIVMQLHASMLNDWFLNIYKNDALF